VSSTDDRFAIHDVLHLYSYLADTDQYERIADEVFSEDGVLDWGLGEVAGRDALREWFANPRPGLLGTSHMITNIMVRIDGDHARALSKMIAWHWFEDESRSEGPFLQEANVVLVGGYEDDLRRGPAGWRVSRRRAHQFGPGGVGIGPALPKMIQRLLQATRERRPTW
jgi:SnoaL-like domain